MSGDGYDVLQQRGRVRTAVGAMGTGSSKGRNGHGGILAGEVVRMVADM